MTTLAELLSLHDRLTAMHVERWVARGLLRPAGSGDAWTFEQIDGARVRLLAELEGDIGFDGEAVETIVSLVDQVHTLRSQLDLLAPMTPLGRTALSVEIMIKRSVPWRCEASATSRVPPTLFLIASAG